MYNTTTEQVEIHNCIDEVMKKKKIGPKAVYNGANLSIAALTNYRKNITQPTIPVLKKIAAVLKVEPEDLIVK